MSGEKSPGRKGGVPECVCSVPGLIRSLIVLASADLGLRSLCPIGLRV
jgi:hypothetical protein